MSSGIGGKRRESGDFSKKVGLVVAEVIAINPTAKEYIDVLGFPEKEDTKEMEYRGESRDGNTYFRLDFWVKQVEGDFKQKIVFFLEDKVRVNREGDKTQFINNIGVCSWAADESGLPPWFTERDFRPAYSGEEELYGFLRTWLGHIDFRDKESELKLDWKKLMKGNIKDLVSQIDGEFCAPFVALATIITKEVENEVKEYQGIYNRAFLPEYSMKHFRLLDYNDDMVQANIETKDQRERKLHEKFVSIVVGEYGCKDFFKLSELADYNSKENVVSSDSTKDGSGDDSSSDASPSY